LRKRPGKKVVLIETGALNPAHKTHLRMASVVAYMLNKDPKFVDANGPVVSVVLSPSHDRYLQGKMINKQDVIPGNIRKILLDLSIKDFNREENFNKIGLFSNDWELSQPGFVDFPDVTDSLFVRLSAAGIKDLQVMYLAGADHFLKAIGRYLIEDSSRTRAYRAVAMNRKDKEYPLGRFEHYFETYGYTAEEYKNHFLLTIDKRAKEEMEVIKRQFDGYDDAASSTRVREALKKRDMIELKNLMYPSALQYIKDHNFLGF